MNTPKPKRVKDEQLFFDSVKSLIENTFTQKNINFSSYYYVTNKDKMEFQQEIEDLAAHVLRK